MLVASRLTGMKQECRNKETSRRTATRFGKMPTTLVRRLAEQHDE